MPKRKSSKTETVGTIKGIDTILSRPGRVNLAQHPEISGHVHRSKRDYDRKKEKARVKAALKGL